MIRVDSELLARHDRPGPRYTSYPTAVEFSDSFGPEKYAIQLDAAAQRPDEPLSLYVHLPFCEERCSFCACHVVVTKRPEVADPYLGRVLAEADLIADRLGDRNQVVQYHWGGGTPTHYAPDVLVELHEGLQRRFELATGAEVAIEVDPRVTTPQHLESLAEVGFNRISLGVQDLDPEVQRLIGRNQTREQSEDVYSRARSVGFDSINLDLIYGLPGQTESTLQRTLEAVIAMRPDRLAVYSFAFVPWMRPHQKRMDDTLLPDTDTKFALLALVVSALTDAGYLQIGMDHFALPGDEIVTAVADGTLSRNFMGYTTKRNTEMIALGTSGISDVAGAYAQNHRRLASYYESVDRGELPVERGYALDLDDRVRRYVITELMCNGVIDLASIQSKFGVDGLSHLSAELTELASSGGLVEEGMATIDGSVVQTTELGTLFVRRTASVFDAYTKRRATNIPMFSKTV